MSTPFSPAPAGSPARTRRMTTAVTVLLIATEAYFFSTANVRSPVHLQLGLLMIFLAFLPALQWARKGKTTLPVFEVLIFTTANTYAFPLLNGHEDLLRYAEDTITSTAAQVVLFQLTAICVYALTPASPGTHRFWRDEVIGPRMGQMLGHGITLSTIYVLLSTFTTVIPGAVGSILRAVFFGIGIICIFITSRRLGQGLLGAGERLFFFVNLFVQCTATGATLVLVGAISIILLALVGYVSASGRIPVLLSAAILATLAVLHSGKSQMRAKYWDPAQTTPAFSAVPTFYAEWFERGLSRDEENVQKKMTSKLIDRTSLLHILCLVVNSSPDPLPHLEGETYAHIPGQFVPRFFWAGKPPAHVSTSRLSVYYGLQTEEDTVKTTIGFGMLAESYANFGFLGVVGIASFLGVLFKKITGLAEGGPMLSYGGILLVILLAWSFQVEFTLSLWLSSLYQACVAVLLLPFVLKKLVNG